MNKNVSASEIIERSQQFQLMTYEDFANQRLEKNHRKEEEQIKEQEGIKEKVEVQVDAVGKEEIKSDMWKYVVTAVCSTVLTALVIKKIKLYIWNLKIFLRFE